LILLVGYLVCKELATVIAQILLWSTQKMKPVNSSSAEFVGLRGVLQAVYKVVTNVTGLCREQKELVLYPNKSGCVRDLLEEARKQVTTSPDVGSGRLRFVVILC